AENTAFSAAGEDVITRKIEIEKENLADKLSPEEFEEHYDIERTTKEIIEGDYKRIALQFPDELLHDSVPIYRTLKHRLG
ncbi:hypothetical protein POSPLADRAFT_1088663, partial [Postia placenta MAD-698-R-SB12]